MKDRGLSNRAKPSVTDLYYYIVPYLYGLRPELHVLNCSIRLSAYRYNCLPFLLFLLKASLPLQSPTTFCLSFVHNFSLRAFTRLLLRAPPPTTPTTFLLRIL
jgi:hypothetical protein